MADRNLMVKQLTTVFEENQAEVLAEVIYDSYNNLVRRDDFNELKEIVRNIAETQDRTDQHLAELADAQKRTEQRVEDLGKAQQRTEQRVEELAEAQQRTEEAQQRTETAQQRTELAVQRLAREVGGLSNRLGGDLEDVAAIVIEDTLHREFGWEVDELSRSWQEWEGVQIEVDVFGKAEDPSRPGLQLWIVGEVKFNMTQRDVNRFGQLVARASNSLDGEVVPVCFCYRIRPQVQKVLKEEGYNLVMSSGRMPK